MKQITVPVNELIFSDVPKEDERYAEIEKGNPERTGPILIIKRPADLPRTPGRYKWVIIDGNRRAELHKDENISALLLETDEDVEEAKKLIHDPEHKLRKRDIKTIAELEQSVWRLINYEIETQRPFSFSKYRK